MTKHPSIEHNESVTQFVDYFMKNYHQDDNKHLLIYSYDETIRINIS